MFGTSRLNVYIITDLMLTKCAHIRPHRSNATSCTPDRLNQDKWREYSGDPPSAGLSVKEEKQ